MPLLLSPFRETGLRHTNHDSFSWTLENRLFRDGNDCPLNPRKRREIFGSAPTKYRVECTPRHRYSLILIVFPGGQGYYRDYIRTSIVVSTVLALYSSGATCATCCVQFVAHGSQSLRYRPCPLPHPCTAQSIQTTRGHSSRGIEHTVRSSCGVRKNDGLC